VEKLDFGKKRFEIVTMNHALEHVKDPIAGLRTCWRVLKPGGHIVVLTPNVESLGHRYFGEHCVSLDPPRHLYLYSPKTLKRIIEHAGFEVERLETSTRLAGPTWVTSNQIRQTGSRQKTGSTVWGILRGIPFSFVEKSLHLFSPDVGEEVILIGRKTRAVSEYCSSEAEYDRSAVSCVR
jgi:SAM-dependent methyltransferase